MFSPNTSRLELVLIKSKLPGITVSPEIPDILKYIVFLKHLHSDLQPMISPKRCDFLVHLKVKDSGVIRPRLFKFRNENTF